MVEIAVGVPGWPAPSTSWDWWALVGIALTLMIVRRSLRVRITMPVVAVALLGGLAFGALVHAAGTVPAAGTALLVASLLRLLRRSTSTRASSPPTV